MHYTGKTFNNVRHKSYFEYYALSRLPEINLTVSVAPTNITSSY